MTQRDSNTLSESAIQAKKKLEHFRTLINPIISEYFDEQIKKVRNQFTPHAVYAMKALKDYTERGGKRLRGSFVYYVYKMYGGQKDVEALKMTTAIEIVQAYLLMIDDFMDLSDTRRKGPSGHIMFRDYYKSQKFDGMDEKHFGNCMAVMTGLIGFHLAMQLINDLDFDDSIKVLLSQYLNRNVEVTAYGQISDVINPLAKDVKEEDIINTLKWKTGVYTYQNPILNGAVLAGVIDEEQIEILTNYAIPAGIAFQIQDDILGVFGDEESLGKSTKSDIEEGKYTLLIHKALEVANESQKETIRKALGNKNISDSLFDDLKQILIETGSLEYSRNLAHKYVTQAQKALKEGYNDRWSKEGYEYLNGIADYMIERNV